MGKGIVWDNVTNEVLKLYSNIFYVPLTLMSTIVLDFGCNWKCECLNVGRVSFGFTTF